MIRFNKEMFVFGKIIVSFAGLCMAMFGIALLGVAGNRAPDILLELKRSSIAPGLSDFISPLALILFGMGLMIVGIIIFLHRKKIAVYMTA